MASAASFSPRSDHRHSAQNADLPHSSFGPYPPSGFDPSLSGIAVAAAGDSLRRAYLDESALSPSEYRSYVPALLTLQPAESEIQGLYDEQSALHYLREKCRLELKDEAMILSLFERTPLGIQPGHFYAWLRLVSWVQQGKRPRKSRLFTQTQPARTYTVSPSRRRAKSRPNSPSAVVPPQPVQQEEPVLQPPTHTPRHPAGKVLKPRPTRPRIAHPQPPVPSPTAPVKSKNPFLTQQDAQPLQPSAPSQGTVSVVGAGAEPAPRPVSPNPPAPRAHHPHLRPEPVPSLRQPAASSVSAHKPLPLDALIGFNPAPNPFKHRPRLVRPTPVVASKSGLRPSPPPMWEDPTLQRVANTTSRAPISPLIQAGLNAASQVQRAKMALPPKTYTTIQRSGPSKPKLPRKMRGQSLGEGETQSAGLVAPPPRRATGTTDLNWPRRNLRSEEGDTNSVLSARSIRSGQVRRPEHVFPGIGDLLGSHLASLGAGGRPKSRTALREESRLTVPYWSKDQEPSTAASSTHPASGLSPRRVMSRSPAPTLVEHSSNDDAHTDEEEHPRPSSTLGQGEAPSAPAPMQGESAAPSTSAVA